MNGELSFQSPQGEGLGAPLEAGVLRDCDCVRVLMRSLLFGRYVNGAPFEIGVLPDSEFGRGPMPFQSCRTFLEDDVLWLRSICALRYFWACRVIFIPFGTGVLPDSDFG